jgi:hypothetical protein
MAVFAAVVLSCSDGTSPDDDDNDSVQEPAGLSISLDASTRRVEL